MAVILKFTWQKPSRMPSLGIPAVVVGQVPLVPTRLIISGVTRDSTGAILGGVTVTLHRTSDECVLETCTSDAVTGEYRFSAIGLSRTYYVVAYKAGAPDLTGTTVNTLLGV